MTAYINYNADVKRHKLNLSKKFMRFAFKHTLSLLSGPLKTFIDDKIYKTPPTMSTKLTNCSI